MYRLVRARFENILEIEKDDFFGKVSCQRQTL